MALGVVFTAALLAAAPLKVAAPGLKLVNVPAETGEFCSERLALQLGREGLRVVTSSEMKSLLGLERQKQLLGCSDASSSCVAELADALGANALLIGSIARFASEYQINLRVISSTGAELGAFVGTAKSEQDLLDELAGAARVLARQMLPASNTPRRWAWLPAAGGVVAASVSAILLGEAANWHGSLVGANAAQIPLATARQYRDQGPTVQGVGFGLLGVGVAALGLAAWMFFSGEPARVGPNGVTF